MSKKDTKEPKDTEDTKEPKKEPAGKLWQYVGKVPTRAAGRLVYPGNVVRAEKKPGPKWKPFKGSK